MSMSDDEIIAVVQARKEGKTIQFKYIYGRQEWHDTTSNSPVWNFHERQYRVKPEPPKPREFWITKCNDVANGIQVHEHEPMKFGCCEEIIHVREVLPETK